MGGGFNISDWAHLGIHILPLLTGLIITLHVKYMKLESKIMNLLS